MNTAECFVVPNLSQVEALTLREAVLDGQEVSVFLQDNGDISASQDTNGTRNPLSVELHYGQNRKSTPREYNRDGSLSMPEDLLTSWNFLVKGFIEGFAISAPILLLPTVPVECGRGHKRYPQNVNWEDVPREFSFGGGRGSWWTSRVGDYLSAMALKYGIVDAYAKNGNRGGYHSFYGKVLFELPNKSLLLLEGVPLESGTRNKPNPTNGYIKGRIVYTPAIGKIT